MDIVLKMPASDEVIREETKKFSEQIAIRRSEIEMLIHAIKHYQKLCKHPGQKTGCNERDGSWANPCPICGESH